MLRSVKFIVGVAVAAGFFGAASGAQAYEVVKVGNGGSINGSVKFEGTPPEPERLIIGKDNAICGNGDALRSEIKVGDDGGLSNVIVFLEKIERGKSWPVEKAYTVNQTRCSFDPFLQVVPKGAQVRFVNNDPVLHNLHLFEVIGRARRTLFNVAQPNQGQADVKIIDTTRGNVVELTCDAHNWMSGWLYVIEHPYFAVVGTDGNFSIEDVPEGAYKLIAWHPVLGSRAQEISVPATAKISAGFAFSVSK